MYDATPSAAPSGLPSESPTIQPTLSPIQNSIPLFSDRPSPTIVPEDNPTEGGCCALLLGLARRVVDGAASMASYAVGLFL